MGIVYSTNENFKFENEKKEQETVPKKEQLLKLRLEVKGRGGKKVTIINNFIGLQGDLEKLSKEIKNFCATGGSIKDGEIIIQGDLKDKIKKFLEEEGYKTKG